MANNPQWQSDLQWLLSTRFAGRGGLVQLVAKLALDSDHISYQTAWGWTKGLRVPNHENRRALRKLREYYEGGE